MKKIVKPTGSIRLKGFAEGNGVAFEASKFSNPILFSFFGTLATVDESDNITCKTLNYGMSRPLIDMKIFQLSEMLFKISCYIGIISMLINLFFVFTKLIVFDILTTIAFFSISVMFLYKGFAIFVARLRNDQEIVNFSKFLAAKNAVENAFYDLRKIPNVEEAKKYSIFSIDSNYLIGAPYATFIIVNLFLRFIPDLWYFLCTFLALILILILAQKKMLFFWQFLIVSKPDDIHYKTAIASLTQNINQINSIEISTQSFENFETEHFSEEKCKYCDSYDFCKESHGNMVKINVEFNLDSNKE